MAFPTTPANGDTHTVGSVTWSYNSTTDIWAQANTSGSTSGSADIGLHEFISTSGAISSGTASVVFANQFDSSKYDHYLFIFTNVKPTAAGYTLRCDTSTDNGSNYATTYGDYHREGATNNIDYHSLFVATSVGSGSSANGASGRFELYQPLSSTTNTSSISFLTKNGASSAGTAGPDRGPEYSGRNANEANNAVRFIFSLPSSTIASGEIELYGLKKG